MTGPEVTAESLLLGAAASAALEGSTSSVDDVRAGHGDAVAAGALRVSSELLGLLPVWRSSPVQALARLHSVAADAADRDDVGRPRSAAGAARLHALGDRLRDPTAAPALAVAARRARRGGATRRRSAPSTASSPAPPNGWCSSTAGSTRRRSPCPRPVMPPTRRRTARRCAAYGSGGVGGVTTWLLHAAQAYTRGAQAAPLPAEHR